MKRSEWSPPDVDTSRPSPARMYDYLLGGSHNFAVDRAVIEQLMRYMPDLPSAARVNRAFLRRTVRFCVEAGIRQFLDLGSGIPTVGNVHDIAQGLAPQARVVYVDIDPIAVEHSLAILADNSLATAVQADLRDAAGILADPGVTDLLDLTAPVAVLFVSVLQFVAVKDRPVDIVAQFRDATVPGSYLVIAHPAVEEHTAERFHGMQRVLAENENRLVFRTREEITAFFDGYRLVEPGLVRLPLWHPESAQEISEEDRLYSGYGGVGRK